MKKNSIWLSVLMLSSGRLLAHPEPHRPSTPMECDDQRHYSLEHVVGSANQAFASYLHQTEILQSLLTPEELQPLLLSHVAQMFRAIEEGPACPAEMFYPQEEEL